MTALFGRNEFAELSAIKKTGNVELLGRFKSDGTIGVTRDIFTADANSPNLSTIKKTGNVELLAF